MDRSQWVFMKQFASETAVLKTPRPVTFELGFFAAVAAHSFLPGREGSALFCLGFLCTSGRTVVSQRRHRSLGPGHLSWISWWSIQSYLPCVKLSNYLEPTIAFGESAEFCWDLGQGVIHRTMAPGKRVKSFQPKHYFLALSTFSWVEYSV